MSFLGIPYGSNRKMMSRMEYDIYHNPIYAIGAAFFGGILFSPWSLGIIYFVLFLFFWEFCIYSYYTFKNWDWSYKYRLAIILAAFLGFLIGRHIIDESDHMESVNEFKSRMRRYLKAVNWMKDDEDKKDDNNHHSASKHYSISEDSSSFDISSSVYDDSFPSRSG